MKTLFFTDAVLLCSLAVNAADINNITAIPWCQGGYSNSATFVTAHANADLTIESDAIAEDCGHGGWSWCRVTFYGISTDSNGHFVVPLDEPNTSVVSLEVTVNVPVYSHTWYGPNPTC